MFGGFCHFGNWGSLGNFGVWGGIGLMILNMVFWLGLIAGLSLLVVWAIRRIRTAGTVPQAAGQPTAKEILQAQYARGEITRQQYELRKKDIG